MYTFLQETKAWGGDIGAIARILRPNVRRHVSDSGVSCKGCWVPVADPRRFFVFRIFCFQDQDSYHNSRLVGEYKGYRRPAKKPGLTRCCGSPCIIICYAMEISFLLDHNPNWENSLSDPLNYSLGLVCDLCIWKERCVLTLIIRPRALRHCAASNRPPSPV